MEDKASLPLSGKIKSDLKQAQLSRDEIKVSTLRLFLSEIKNKEIESGETLSDEDIVSVCQREIKKRKEAAAAFRSGGREDSALKEEAELKILEGYLPAQITNEELTKIVSDIITELGASGMVDMGKVIGAVMGKVKGKADGATVSAVVKDKLTNV
ncbi:MAG: GatB/YqeY domain-containing protein [Candidatus Daviesbacteria bacterium]|nr:GatB/YqeY domain-containing protein [Candidatus Daviesbacteria bacterium]